MSDAFSAIMMTGAFVAPPDEIRHDRRVDHAQPVYSTHPQFGIDHGQRVAIGAHLAGADRVMDGAHSGADVGVDFRIGLFVGTGRDLLATKRPNVR